MGQSTEHTYIAIDLKSFYASVECAERGLDPLNTNLVVADASRTDKTICLAVSPSLKAYGISGRARLFEVVQRVREVNGERARRVPQMRFTGKSVFDNELKEHPDWALDYITAPPRMAYYIDYSTRIYDIYLKYISVDDIHVYSIDEVFLDVTHYLATYQMTPEQLANAIMLDILRMTGITATAGIGTNMYLCKVAMDIVAKHATPDENGARIGRLDERSYRELLWDHQPITDFWRVGRGIACRLEDMGVNTMGQLARLSVQNEEMLYKAFGVNAELLIDHAWGWEPCTIDYIKAYRPEVNSLSSGQVLTCAYTYEKARVVIQEMADGLALDMVAKRLTTSDITVTVGYDRESLTREDIAPHYQGPVVCDHYGRMVPKHAHGSARLKAHTSSARLIREAVLQVFERITNPILLIRRLNVTAGHVITEEQAAKEAKKPVQLDLFTDYEALKKEETREQEAMAKERRIQEALLNIKGRFGKNAILKGLNFAEGATAKERNSQIGGHKA